MMPKDNHLYNYRARVVRVVDGDTLILDFDLGLKTWLRKERCRLSGIDAPELRGDERKSGLASKAYLEALIQWEGLEVRVHTEKDVKGKYGRWIVTVWTLEDDKSINQRMVESGHAKAWE